MSNKKGYKTEQAVKDFMRSEKTYILHGFLQWQWCSATEAEKEEKTGEQVENNLQRLEDFLMSQIPKKDPEP